MKPHKQSCVALKCPIKYLCRLASNPPEQSEWRIAAAIKTHHNGKMSCMNLEIIPEAIKENKELINKIIFNSTN